MSAVATFFRWWGGELAALAAAAVPSAWRRPVLLIVAGDDAIRLRRLAGRRERDLGTLDALPRRRLDGLRREIRHGRLDPVLALAPKRVVRRRVTLPVAAAEDLDGVLAFEFDRLTPFRRDEVRAAHRLVARNEAAGTIEAELVFAVAASLAPVEAALREAGLGPVARIDVLGEDARPLGLDLAGAGRSRPRRAGRRAAFALGAVAALLALALFGVETRRASERVERLADAVFQARAAARRVETAATAATGDAALVAYRAKAAAPSALAALAAVTDALPDDTYLDRLGLDGREVTATGLSKRATALVALIDAHPRLARPRFTAPITRVEDGLERFSLAFELVAETVAAEPGR